MPSAWLQKKNSEKPTLSEEASNHRIIERWPKRSTPASSTRRSAMTSPSSPSTTARGPSTTSRRSCSCRSLRRSRTRPGCGAPSPWSARSGLSSTARGTRALCTRRSRSTFERRSKSRGVRRKGGVVASLLSTPRGSSHGPRGAPARCASCTSSGDTPKLSKSSAQRTWERSLPSWGLL